VGKGALHFVSNPYRENRMNDQRGFENGFYYYGSDVKRTLGAAR
jgi:hypothetical protein